MNIHVFTPIALLAACGVACSSGSDSAASEQGAALEASVPAALVGEWRGAVKQTRIQFSLEIGDNGAVRYRDNRENAGGGALCNGRLLPAPSTARVATEALACTGIGGQRLRPLSLTLEAPGGFLPEGPFPVRIASSDPGSGDQAVLQRLPEVLFGKPASYAGGAPYKLFFQIAGARSQTNLDLTFEDGHQVTADGKVNLKDRSIDLLTTETRGGFDYDVPTKGKFTLTGSAMHMEFPDKDGKPAIAIDLDLSKVANVNGIRFAESESNFSASPIDGKVTSKSADQTKTDDVSKVFFAPKSLGYPTL